MEDRIWQCAAELEDMLMFLEHCAACEISTGAINENNQDTVETEVRKAFETLDGVLDSISYYGERDE